MFFFFQERETGKKERDYVSSFQEYRETACFAMLGTLRVKLKLRWEVWQERNQGHWWREMYTGEEMELGHYD